MFLFFPLQLRQFSILKIPKMTETLDHTHKQQSSLQKKMQLLAFIRSGNIQQIAKLTKQLSSSAKTNPQLYQKFSNFVEQHKQQLIQNEEDQKQDNNQNVQIINVDDETIDDKDWDSDDSIDLSDSQCSQSDDQQTNKKQLFKEVQNIKNLIKEKKSSGSQCSKQKTLNPKIDSSKAKKQTVANPGKQSSSSNVFIKKEVVPVLKK